MPDFFKEEDRYAIVADIGGTNARFSQVDLDNFSVNKVKVYACADFSNFSEAWKIYLAEYAASGIRQAAVAIACPVFNDEIRMTNLSWRFSIQEMKEQLALDHFHVLNDFTAAALSLTELNEKDRIYIGPHTKEQGGNKLIVGSGTGLGVAQLLSTESGFFPIASEGGHADWAPQNEQEWFIHQYLSKIFGHVSYERILSGPGLEYLYQALAAYQNLAISALTAAEVVEQAINGLSALAKDTINQFLASLGSFVGDLSLISCATGVYLTGGVLPRLLPLIESSSFRERFENKGRFTEFNRRIPTFLITAQQPGLIGAAVYLKQKLGLAHHAG